MSGFEVALDDLRDSSKRVSEAADVVAGVRDRVKGMDLHTNPPSSGLSGMFDRALQPPSPTNAFGTAVGMPSVAYAYDQHRRRVADKLEELHQNTQATARALGQVADLYEEYDTSLQSHFAQMHESL